MQKARKKPACYMPLYCEAKYTVFAKKKCLDDVSSVTIKSKSLITHHNNAVKYTMQSITRRLLCNCNNKTITQL